MASRCDAGEREGEGRFQRLEPRGVPLAGNALLGALPVAHDGKRQLAGQKLVVGEAPAGGGRAARARRRISGRWTARSASAKAGNFSRSANGTVEPVLDVADCFERARDDAGQDAAGDPLRQRIDRLEAEAVVERGIGAVDALGPVGVRHLRPALPPLDRAGDAHPVADGEGARQPLLAAAEIEDRQRPGVVLAEDARRRTRPARPFVPHDLHRERRDFLVGCVGDPGQPPAVDEADREVRQNVEHARFRRAFPAEKVGKTVRAGRADALKAIDRTRQRSDIEKTAHTDAPIPGRRFPCVRRNAVRPIIRSEPRCPAPRVPPPIWPPAASG